MSGDVARWACVDLNHGPLPCQGVGCSIQVAI
jgi:hypothetical protein